MTTPYDGTEDVMSKYAPEGCTTEQDVLDGIDEIEKRDRNKYCTDVQMARIDNDGQAKMAWLKRVATFQIVLNFIEEAMQTVPPSDKIDKRKASYTQMKKQSQKAYDALDGGTRLHAGDSSSSRLKRPKVPEIPKFDVHNKHGMQTFLNSMELLSHSYKFNDDKELAQFYLNNLTENSKQTIFAIYPMNDASFYENSKAVIKYLKGFINPNVRLNAQNELRTLKMTESGGLYAYFKSFTKLIADLGDGALSNEMQVNQFIAGLNANAIQNTNLLMHMHTFFRSQPTSTITELYAEADKMISLAKTNNGFNGNGKRAGPAPRPHQRDNGFKQKRPYNGNTSSQAYTPKDNKPPQPNTPASGVVCGKCQHKGHFARDCTAIFSTTGKFLGTGTPPANHYWTKKNAADAKATKKTAMVNTPPQQQRQQPPQQRPQPPQQQQQQYEKKKKKTVGAITLADLSFPPGFSPPRSTPVLDILEGSVSEPYPPDPPLVSGDFPFVS